MLIDDPLSPTPKISAVLDWDMARAMPIEVAFELPSWLWNRPVLPNLANARQHVFWDALEGENVHDRPCNAKDRAIRLHFIRLMSDAEPDFVSVYKAGQTTKARTLLHLCNWRVNDHSYLDRMESFVLWWHRKQQPPKPKKIERLRAAGKRVSDKCLDLGRGAVCAVKRRTSRKWARRGEGDER